MGGGEVWQWFGGEALAGLQEGYEPTSTALFCSLGRTELVQPWSRVCGAQCVFVVWCMYVRM